MTVNPARPTRRSHQLKDAELRRAPRSRAGAAGDRSRTARTVTLRLARRLRAGCSITIATPARPSSAAAARPNTSPRPCCRGPRRRCAFMQWRGSMARARRLHGQPAARLRLARPRRRAALGRNRFHAGARARSKAARRISSTPVLELAGPPGHRRHRADRATPAEELFESRKLMLGDLSAGRDPRAQPARRAGDTAVGAARRRHHAVRARARRSLFPARVRGKPVGCCSSICRASAWPTATGCWRCCSMSGSARASISRKATWSPEKGRPFVETDGRSLFLPGGDARSRRGDPRRAARRRPHASSARFDRAAMTRAVRRGRGSIFRTPARCRGRRSSCATATMRCASS